MDFERINPVALVSGATFGAGAACAHPLAFGADGGLILIDRDAAALDTLADRFGNHAPERVSLLAHDGGDDDAWWARAGGFIKDQYGRLDWAVLNACAPRAGAGDLIEFNRAGAQIDAVQRALRTVMPLMRFNSQGGAIVIVAAAAGLKPDAGLLATVRTAAKEGASGDIRINAVALGEAPGAIQSFQDTLRDTGSERAAFEIIANLSPPLARFGPVADINALIMPMLTGQTPVSGVTLVVDGGDEV